MRGLIAILICALLSLAAPVHGKAERILSFHSDIDIAADGSMTVAEAIRVSAAGVDIRRGIYRDFPTRYRDALGNSYVVDFELREVLRDGVSEPWHIEERANGVRIYIGSANSMLAPGTYEYTLRYRTNRQLGFFEEHDELYWNVTGNDWAFAIDSASATVRLPVNVPAQDLSMTGYTGRQGERGGDQVSTLGQGAGQVRSTRALPPGTGLTLVFSWPKGVVQVPSATQRARWVLQDNLGLLLSLLAFIGSAAWLTTMWRRHGRDPEAGVIFPHYEPPGNYSPASARYIARMGYDNRTFTAAIINLAVKGHLEIQQDGGDYTLLRKPCDAELAPGEGAMINKLFRSGSVLALENDNHDQIGAARTAHKRSLRRDYLNRYFRHNSGLLLPSALGSLIIFVVVGVTGIAVPLTGGLVVGVVALHGLFLWLMKAPSRMGRQLMDKLECFKLYLEVAEKDNLDLRHPPEKTPALFERYLPFAFALGVEQEWSEQFSEVFARIRAQSGEALRPQWYRGKFDYARMGEFSRDVGRDFSSAISSAASPPGSSSGGGSGGFSGGGGGGGGGGGW